MRTARPLALAVCLPLAIAACSESGPRDPVAERGRQVYLSQCTVCHASDPSQPGPVGPEVKGSSRELLEAKVLRGSYPSGYKPKRPTSVMPPQTGVAGDIGALAAYLK